MVGTASGLQLVFVVLTSSSSSSSSSSLATLSLSALSHHRSVWFFAASWVDFQKSRLSGLILTSFFGSKMDCSSNWDFNWDLVTLSSRLISSREWVIHVDIVCNKYLMPTKNIHIKSRKSRSNLQPHWRLHLAVSRPALSSFTPSLSLALLLSVCLSGGFHCHFWYFN